MVAAAVPGRFPLHLRRAAEFAAPPDDGAVQQAALGRDPASSVAMPLSISGSFRRITWKFCLCVSQPPL